LGYPGLLPELFPEFRIVAPADDLPGLGRHLPEGSQHHLINDLQGKGAVEAIPEDVSERHFMISIMVASFFLRAGLNNVKNLPSVPTSAPDNTPVCPPPQFGLEGLLAGVE